MLEEKIIVARVLRKFHLESLDEPDDLNIGTEMILRPKNGVRIRFTERNKC